MVTTNVFMVIHSEFNDRNFKILRELVNRNICLSDYQYLILKKNCNIYSWVSLEKSEICADH